MSTNDQIDSICSDITKIMVKYPNLFPIVEIILKDTPNHAELELVLELYCGLRAVARLKNDAMMELWWSMPTTMSGEIKKVLLRDILNEYLKKGIFPKDLVDMYKAEGL